MFTKFYLISSLLIGASTVSAMEFDYFIESDEDITQQSMPPIAPGISFARNDSGSLESGSTSAASESDSDEERRRASQKSIFPSPFYKDTPEGKNRRPKTLKEQCDSVEQRIRNKSLLGDFTETEENAGKRRIFASTQDGITTTITFTSYGHSEKDASSSKKKAKLLVPSKDQPKIDGFTARGVDESQKRSSFPPAAHAVAKKTTKPVKNKGKGSRKSFPPAGAGQKKLDFFLPTLD